MGWTFYNSSGQQLKTSIGLTQAVEDDIEAETNQDTYVPPDLIKHSPGVAKAWGQVTYSTGTPTLSSPDHGIGTIADTALGRLKVPWSVAFSSAVYATAGITSLTNGGNIIGFGGGDGQQTTYTEIGILADFATTYEDANIEIVVFGDQC